MARPPKPKHEQRRHKVKFLLTGDELDGVRARAAGKNTEPQGEQAQAVRDKSIHRFAREQTLDGRIVIRQRAGLPFAAVHQSNRLGVVLYQVCDHAESHGEPVPPFGGVRSAIDAVFDYAYETTVKAPGLDNGERPHEVKFLLTNAECRKVRAAAAGLNLGVNDYARYCATGAPFYVLAGAPFPEEVINDLRIQGRAIWQALGHSRAAGVPLPPFDAAARILEGIYHTVYLPRIRDGCQRSNGQKLQVAWCLSAAR